MAEHLVLGFMCILPMLATVCVVNDSGG